MLTKIRNKTLMKMLPKGQGFSMTADWHDKLRVTY
jgi:hypothetical protein